MCFTLPGRIEKIEKGEAIVNNGTTKTRINLAMVLGAKKGDYILYAMGRAIRIVSKSEVGELNLILDNKK